MATIKTPYGNYILLMWAAIAFFLLVTLNSLYDTRTVADEQTRRLLLSYTRLVESHASATFDRTDLVLKQAAGLLADSELTDPAGLPPSRLAQISSRLKALQADGAGIVAMSLTNAHGVVFANTVGAPPGSYLGDQDYFLQLKGNATHQPAISEAILGRLSGKWGVQVARRIETADGRFAGMVVANVGLDDYFLPFYQSLQLSNGMVIGLWDRQHRLLVRYPQKPERLGQPSPPPREFLDFDAAPSELMFERVSPVDSTSRRVGFRKLTGHPIYAIVGVPRSDYLAAWRDSATRSALAMLLALGGGVAATLMLRHRHNMAQEAQLSAETLHLALTAAQAGAWSMNHRKDTVTWSPEMLTLYGQTRPPRNNEDWYRLVLLEDRERVRGDVERALSQGLAGFRTEFRVPMPDGSVRWIAGIGTSLKDSRGRPLRSLGVNLDVTANKRAEMAVQAARDEALRAKALVEKTSLARSKFLAAASHDLRQPAQSLLLLIDVARPMAIGPMARVVAQMDRALDALRLLLDGLLDISKLDAGVMTARIEPVEATEVLGPLAEEYELRARERGLELRYVPRRCRLMGDRALLERLMRNLLENALRYTPQGKILLGCRTQGDRVAIHVMDTGIGIDSAHQEAIFEEFQQVGNEERDRSQGLGLGLAIVRRIADLMDGEIRLRSVPDRGSDFALLLPRPPAALPAPAQPPALPETV